VINNIGKTQRSVIPKASILLDTIIIPLLASGATLTARRNNRLSAHVQPQLPTFTLWNGVIIRVVSQWREVVVRARWVGKIAVAQRKSTSRKNGNAQQEIFCNHCNVKEIESFSTQIRKNCSFSSNEKFF